MQNYLVNHVTQMIITLMVVIGAYVALVVTGYGDAATDLRLPMIALITAIAGASPAPGQIPLADLRSKEVVKAEKKP
jgi:hypothetical protein